MVAITEDQELTLFRWARAHGSRRPEGSDRRLIEEAKGLTSEQIDSWWDGFLADSGSWAGPGTSIEVEQPGWIQVLEAGNAPFGAEGGDMLRALPVFPRQSAHPSLAGSYSKVPSISDRSSTATSSSAFSGASEMWDHAASRASSATTTSLHSEVSDNWDYVDIFNSSSDGRLTLASSSYAEDIPPSYAEDTPPSYAEDTPPSYSGDVSSSSHIPFEDLLASDMRFTAQASDYIDASQLNLTIKPGSQNRLIQNGPGARHLYTEPSTMDETTSPADTTSDNLPLSVQPPKPIKSYPIPSKIPGNFACTTCGLDFTNKKGDWKRHESSRCEPQTLWVCMLGDPAISVRTGTFGLVNSFLCAFCPVTLPRAEMNAHLVGNHRITTCIRKEPNSTSRVFPGRKDKLKHHLRTVHKLSDSPPLSPNTRERGAIWETWHTPVLPVKKAWGCGFCGVCLFTWEGRLEHVASHFSRDKMSISSWSHDLVLVGLLRQPRNESNISERRMEALVRRYVDKRVLGLDKEVADLLKTRLEVRDGRPGELADALRMAVVKGSGSSSSTTDMASSLLADSKAWPNSMVKTSTGSKTGMQGVSGVQKQLHGGSGTCYNDQCLSQPCEPEEVDIPMGEYF